MKKWQMSPAAWLLWLSILVLLASIFGCGPRFDHGWEIIGAPVPAEFEREVFIAVEVIREQEGVLHREWGGTIEVLDAPFSCPVGQCSGWSGDPHAIRVLYNEALGYGPNIGRTAIEWELCNAARQMRTCGTGWFGSIFGPCDGNDGDGTLNCVQAAMPKIRKEMTP